MQLDLHTSLQNVSYHIDCSCMSATSWHKTCSADSGPPAGRSPPAPRLRRRDWLPGRRPAGPQCGPAWRSCPWSSAPARPPLPHGRRRGRDARSHGPRNESIRNLQGCLWAAGVCDIRTDDMYNWLSSSTMIRSVHCRTRNQPENRSTTIVSYREYLAARAVPHLRCMLPGRLQQRFQWALLPHHCCWPPRPPGTL